MEPIFTDKQLNNMSREDLISLMKIVQEQTKKKDTEIQLLKDKQKELEFLNAMLSDRLTLAQRKQFGASSEKYTEGYEQMNLFNEAEAAGLLLSWSRLWRRLLAVINVRQRNRRLPEKRSLQGFLWSKFPAPCRRRTGTAPTAMPRWRPSEKRSCGKNCGSSPQKWNGSSISRKCLAVRNVRKTALPLSLGLKHQAHC